MGSPLIFRAYPVSSQDRSVRRAGSAAGQALADGLSTRRVRRVPKKGFRSASYISSSYPKLSCRRRNQTPT
jgi:hypothetical protein